MAIQDTTRRSDLLAASLIAGGYLVVATLWILLSDRAVEMIVPPHQLDRITGFQTIKGLTFVTVTAGMLLVLVLRRLRQTRGAERQAAATQEQLLAFADNFPGVVYIRDKQNRFVVLRGVMPPGVRSDEMIGRTDQALHTPDTYARLVNRDQEVIETGQPSQFVESVTINGVTIHYLVHRFPMSSPNGERWVAGLALDVTERQIAEDRIREMARELEKASRMKDQFLANLSHELRTPITAIRLWTEVLRDPKPDDLETVREAAAMIHHSAITQTLLIEDLLDITRIIGGRLKVEFRPVALRDVIRKTAELLQPMADEHHVEVRLDLQDDGAQCRMLGDSRRVQQVFWNLLNNAIKFSKPGQTVDCTLRRSGDEWVLRVADRGCGMTPAMLEHVFERFRQPADGKTAGIGIGLSIVKHLVEAHGGSVLAESDGEGRGATFTVRFPLAEDAMLRPDPEAAAPQPRLSPPSNGDGSSELRGLRILLVEDDPDTRTALTRILERYGAAVTAVESAEAALSIDTDLDLLLSDIGLPDIDGYELVRRLRQRPGWANRPAIACSAYALPEDRTRALDAGYDEFLTKPIDAEELLKGLERHVREMV